MSYAAHNGCYGTSLAGSDNPAFQRDYKPSKETRKLIKQLAIDFPRIWVKNDIESLYILKSDLSHYLKIGYEKGRSFKRMKPTSITKNCSCIICRREIQINNIGNHWDTHFPTKNLAIEYYGKYYKSFDHLREETKCTKGLYQKYYLNGIDPNFRIGKNGPTPNSAIFIQTELQ